MKITHNNKKNLIKEVRIQILLAKKMNNIHNYKEKENNNRMPNNLHLKKRKSRRQNKNNNMITKYKITNNQINEVRTNNLIKENRTNNLIKEVRTNNLINQVIIQSKFNKNKENNHQINKVKKSGKHKLNR